MTPNATRTQRGREWLVAALLYVGLTLWLTWPLAPHAFSHLPQGLLPDPTVPFFNLWTLEWNADRLQHGYAQYWNAPLFFPTQDGFALSEPQALTGLLFALLARSFGSVAAYNATLALFLLANALCARLLARAVSIAPWPATLTGVLMLGLPFVHSELGVLQLCAAFPMLLGFYELVLLSERASPRAILRLGSWLVMSVWTCVYYALFLGLFVLLAAALLARRELLERRFIVAGVLSLALVLVCSWPLLSAQHRTVTRYTRSPGAIQAGSASALSYLQFPPDSPLGRLVPSWSRSRQRRSLYPGAMLCLLAVLGVARARKLPPARFVRYCAFAFVLGLWLSFGTRLRFGDVRPYALTAARYLPGFAQLRSPYRAALFVQSMLVLFAGLGLDVLCRSQRRVWRVPLARVLPSLCVALALLEVTSFGVPLVRFPYEAMFEPWVAWLATQPSGAVAMVPPVNGHKASAYEGTVVGMLQSLRHGHPIVNGYSGFFPPEADQTVGLLKEFPSRVVLRGLRNRQVRYVVVDTRKLDVHAPSFTSAELEPVFDAPPRSVFALRPRQ